MDSFKDKLQSRAKRIKDKDIKTSATSEEDLNEQSHCTPKRDIAPSSEMATDTIEAISSRSTTSTRTVSTAFRPGFFWLPLYGRSFIEPTSVLDVAVAAASPEGLPIALIPLYKVVYGLALKKSRYDISSLASKLIILAGAVASARMLWDWAGPTLVGLLTTSVTIPEDSLAHHYLNDWIVQNDMGSGNRHVRLRDWPSAGDGNSREDGGAEGCDLLNVEPAVSSGWIWFNKSLVYWANSASHNSTTAEGARSRNFEIGTRDGHTLKDDITLYTSRFTRSILSRMLDKAVEPASDRYTTIFRPSFSRALCRWNRSIKPVRPMWTIDMDQSVKDNLVSDIETFVSRQRERWYGERGIPYRRGIMFYGPPGTGKTSTAMAIAGLVNSNIYIANLSNIKNERDLAFVFEAPRKHDILLLEDVDCVGIRHARRRRRGRNNSGRVGGVSLSSLLNHIDGAATQKGVIIIMTSNEPDSLDAALLRPGRIDKRIHFDRASQEVAKSIFCRIYADFRTPEDTTRVDHLAEIFAAKIPERIFTPADIQTFLLNSDTPGEALERVEGFIFDNVASNTSNRDSVAATESFSYDHVPEAQRNSDSNRWSEDDSF